MDKRQMPIQKRTSRDSIHPSFLSSDSRHDLDETEVRVHRLSAGVALSLDSESAVVGDHDTNRLGLLLAERAGES